MSAVGTQLTITVGDQQRNAAGRFRKLVAIPYRYGFVLR